MSEIVIQRVVPARGIPSPAALRRWAHAALAGRPGELTIRVVGASESRALNRRYRGRDKPTNVLSFAYTRRPPRADLVICAPVANREARAQGKARVAHWAHLVVHGVLHVLGYDHERAADARRMEAAERRILAAMDFPDPYSPTPDRQ